MDFEFSDQVVHGTEDSLNMLAEDTGGRAFFGNNDLASTMQHALGEYEGTYIVTYAPADNRLDGERLCHSRQQA